ncbi:cupin domain-containing protein [Aquabacter sp. L1I39]|uniref:cupin domain-containing protein n=1 Tax=Aquabacter sp. L1I39 TaxID=2820278 RepID=UPI001ADA2D96|nr:cupin domain-containing protein [Aquabacter sp. L1I39]QTL04667.1 cupin domain-containing protein [Aquabacter sp. L1I39]
MRVTEAGPDIFYAWGEACAGWRLLDLAHMQVRQEAMPPGACEEPHMHRHAHQFFYVLDGAMTIQWPEGVNRLGRRQGLHVPAGMPHWVRNDGESELVFLLFSAPSTMRDREPVDPSLWSAAAL